MRNARVVGLSADGMSLVVTTDSGEELAIAADDGLRAAVRGDRPRLGQLENEMETSLSPRDIQTRIRSGATLEDVASVAGLPMDRVERFAAPVLAERDHVAITAMAGSVRRRGETSGHRNLRLTVTERLATRGVDLDTLEWDSYRLADGRWAVTVAYPTGRETGRAEFLYDPRGRFSVAGNDDAKGLLGEHPPTSTTSNSESDTEPTVDLNDELALVRATQEPSSTPAEEVLDEATEPTIAVVRTLHRVPDPPAGTDQASADQADETIESDDVHEANPDDVHEPEPDDVHEAEPDDLHEAEPDDLHEVEAEPGSPRHDVLEPELTEHGGGPAESGQTGPVVAELSITEVTMTEVRMHAVVTGVDGVGPTEDSDDWATPAPGPSSGGFSDATAVPETTDGGGWEPAIVVNFPVEPSLVDDGVDSADNPAARSTAERASAPTELAGTDEPGPPGPVVDGDGRADEVREFELESEVEAPPVRRAVKKKRASVPSWDEIMFGGPRPPSGG